MLDFLYEPINSEFASVHVYNRTHIVPRTVINENINHYNLKFDGFIYEVTKMLYGNEKNWNGR